MKKRPYDIVVFGDTCVDMIFRDDDVRPRFGQVEKTVSEYELVMGGSCCIFAAQAAKLGLKVAVLGYVGDDAFGHVIVDTLAAAGVDTRHIQIDKRIRTGLTVHLVEGDDRAMLTYPGSSIALTEADVSDTLLASARHLHYGSLFLQTGLLPRWIDIVRRAKSHGLTVSLDTNWDPSESWDIGLEAALPFLDIMMPNEQEAVHLSGASTFVSATRELRGRLPLLVVKRGAEGATAWQGDSEARRAVASAEQRGDGIGAGDSFDAGFLAGWLNGLPVEDCLSIACTCGRAVAGRIGGIAGQPMREHVPELLACG